MKCRARFVLLLTLTGCQQAPREIAVHQEPTPKPSLASELVPVDPVLARVPLGERLAREASARPARAVRPEQLLAALRDRGVAIVRARQVLASTLGASYCALSVSDAGLVVSLCEFSDPAAARAGAQRSHQQFDGIIAGRRLITQGNSLLTLSHPEGQGAASEARLAERVFATLEPSSTPSAR